MPNTEQVKPYPTQVSITNPSVADILRILESDNPDKWCTFVHEQGDKTVYEVVGGAGCCKEKKGLVGKLEKFAKEREVPVELMIHSSPKGINAVT